MFASAEWRLSLLFSPLNPCIGHKIFDSQRHSPEFIVEPFTEMDLEMDRGMLSPDNIVGAVPDGSSSARSSTSGGTIYHDAQYSTPGTPLLPSFPTAITHPRNLNLESNMRLNTFRLC